MLYRLFFFLVALFWVTMNYLLWRAEFSGQAELRSSVPVDVVWRKILTAPDDSGLAVIRQGKRIGFLRWTPNVGEELATGKIATEEMAPEGMIHQPANYRVDVVGDAMVGNPPTRLHVNLASVFDTNRVWRDFHLRVGIRPIAWEVHSEAGLENVEIKYEEGSDTVWQRTLSFADLRDPRRLLAELGDPGLLALATPMLQVPSPGAKTAGTNVAPALEWQAYNDWLRLRRSQVRIYRLRARLFDQYQVVITVSRVGEILRVELPGGVKLVNEALENW